jgi:alkylated DNA repair dioxygenase AlkB
MMSVQRPHYARLRRPFRFVIAPYITRPEPVTKATALAEQLAFFSGFSGAPQGLRYAAEFISPSTEQELIAHIASLPLQPFQFGQYEGKRRVASFGFRYDSTLRRLQEAEPIPEWLRPIISQVEAFGGRSTQVRQILCTEYDTGAGIGWHRDKPHFDRVFGLSLGSACKFRFRRPIGEKWERVTLDVAPRSLYMMSGASRQVWEHSIPCVEAPRYSITFRTTAEQKAALEDRG